MWVNKSLEVTPLADTRGAPQLPRSLDFMAAIWQIHDHFPEALIGEYDSSQNPDRLLLRSCVSLIGVTEFWTFHYDATEEELRKFDDLANSSMVPLISERLADILRSKAETSIELLPTKIKTRGKEINDYYLLNILREVECVDFQKSELIFIHGIDQVQKFKRLRLIDGCLGDEHIVRCAEYKSFIIVSDKMAQIISLSSVTGRQFVNPSDIKQ